MHRRRTLFATIKKDGTCPIQHMGCSAYGSSFLTSTLLDPWEQDLDVTPLTDSSTSQQNFMGMPVRLRTSSEQEDWQKHCGEYCSHRCLDKGKEIALISLMYFCLQFSFTLHIFFLIPNSLKREQTQGTSFPPMCTYTQGRVNIMTGCKMVCPYSVFFKLGVCQNIRGKALCIISLTYFIFPAWTVINVIQSQFPS